MCAQTLSEPFLTDRKGEIPEGKKGYYAMPIVHCHNGLVTVNYGGEFIQVRQQHAETMCLFLRAIAMPSAALCPFGCKLLPTLSHYVAGMKLRLSCTLALQFQSCVHVHGTYSGLSYCVSS